VQEERGKSQPQSRGMRGGLGGGEGGEKEALRSRAIEGGPGTRRVASRITRIIVYLLFVGSIKVKRVVGKGGTCMRIALTNPEGGILQMLNRESKTGKKKRRGEGGCHLERGGERGQSWA